MNTLSERIAWLMQHFNVSQTELAKIAKISQPSVANWINGRTQKIRSEPALLICSRLKVKPTWLISGIGDPIAGGEPVSEFDRENFNEDDDRFVPIKSLKIRCSAGAGQEPTYEDVTDENALCYKRSWLQKNGFKAEKLVRLDVHGDSMEPTLYDGDHITVNLADTFIRSGHVYAFTYAGEYRVKRLERLMDGTVVVKSDNLDYREEEISGGDEMFRVIGRVVDKSGNGGL